jgi:hypothetical protein
MELDVAMVRSQRRFGALLVVTLVVDAVLVGLSQDRWAIGRVLVMAAVMYGTMQGRRWARWLLVGLCGLSALSLVALVVLLGAKLSAVVVVGSGGLALLYGAIAVVLLRSPQLRRYFAARRRSRLP